jgi:hypothetical protein
MSTPVWANVGVDIQTALGASLTVSGISKANPAVLSYAAGDTDPANGEYFLIEAVGMKQINNMVVRVSAVDTTANTFQCEGLDSTDFDTFVSATAKKITFGKTFATMMDLSMSGGELKTADDSDLHSEIDSEAAVGYTAIKGSSNNRFNPSDAALLEAKSAGRTQTPRALLIRFANGYKVAGYATMGASMVPTGQKGAVVQTPFAFTFKGFTSEWAS